jgi:hypothetical protein
MMTRFETFLIEQGLAADALRAVSARLEAAKASEGKRHKPVGASHIAKAKAGLPLSRRARSKLVAAASALAAKAGKPPLSAEALFGDIGRLRSPTGEPSDA